ncbi:MAG: asparagine synthase-related protein [Bacteroidota bacterium]|jgi:asparagine synthase (glutamine-hydrolysing)
MAGIAGINKPNESQLIKKILEKISHRGKEAIEIVENKSATIGIVMDSNSKSNKMIFHQKLFVQDGNGDGRLAKASIDGRGLSLIRDELGAAPLYYGFTEDESLCFASEVKALKDFVKSVFEFPPGYIFSNNSFNKYFKLKFDPMFNENETEIANKLYSLLSEAVEKRIKNKIAAAWLSGGLDSSSISSIVRKHVDKLHTFSVGLEGSPDLEYAKAAAEFIRSRHHEIKVTVKELIKLLPDVIYHLESFDALLVRSSLTNFVVGKASSDYSDAVFSGEGGDELFAGYEYLKSLDTSNLQGELIDITNRLHNTALQRVDRCSSAHGITAHVPFADPIVFNYAFQIPGDLKLKDKTEKWILRKAMNNSLPVKILNRTKAKFWEGAGIHELIYDYAKEKITDDDFRGERILPNGWKLNSKEELLYYRIFREHFGEFNELSWMGRTKGAPMEK